ncbi:hypothetical protein EDD11_000506 [Mortierella claussenii]|nr:hypothetical protein EDD11_000506 [Mortierella claussenii]
MSVPAESTVLVENVQSSDTDNATVQPQDTENINVVQELEIKKNHRAHSTLDLDAELITVQERLAAIKKEERTGADAEKVALEELEKSTQGLITIREQLSNKEKELAVLDESDNSRADVQTAVDRLTKEVGEKEHQWSATKEVWYREFGPITENKHSGIGSEVQAKAHDIKVLQDQIESLQKQLDAVSIRRKQMAADAEEQHRRLAEEGGGISDEA